MALGSRSVMKVGDRLTLIGTIHVDPESTSVVKRAILGAKPEVVALEIDEARLYALQNPGRVRPGKFPGASFLAMMLLEKFAGQLTGSAPGAEMLVAAEAARRVGAKLELVDVPIHTTILGIRHLPLKERIRLLTDSIGSLILLPLGKPDFASLTMGVEEQLLLFRGRYPGLSRLLLDLREDYMSNRISTLLKSTTGDVVAVVGFGHLAALGRRLAGYTGKPAFSASFNWTLLTSD